MRLLPLLARVGEGEERQGLGLGQRLHLPQCRAPVEAERAEAIGGGEFFERRHRHAEGMEIGDGEGLLLRAVLQQQGRILRLQAIDLAKPQPHGGALTA